MMLFLYLNIIDVHINKVKPKSESGEFECSKDFTLKYINIIFSEYAQFWQLPVSQKIIQF